MVGDLDENRSVGTPHCVCYMVSSKKTVVAGSHGTPAIIVPEMRGRALIEKLEGIMKKWETDEDEDLSKDRTTAAI